MTIQAKVAKKANKPSSTAGRRRVRFEVEAEPGSQVSLVGSFNDWDEKSHPLSEKKPGLFVKLVYLHTEKYEYKFVINGDWVADSNCPTYEPNEFGTLNSVLTVQ
ncbi:MAG: 1,4-alpha-glucan branching enzyme [Verrucomicrobiales bacterium]|jgi:1,4-alpha-glucan branching enzyme